MNKKDILKAIAQSGILITFGSGIVALNLILDIHSVFYILSLMPFGISLLHLRWLIEIIEIEGVSNAA